MLCVPLKKERKPNSHHITPPTTRFAIPIVPYQGLSIHNTLIRGEWVEEW
jgi:hypothetical protein